MIILPIHKKIQDEIIVIQLKEWLYQSHCWDAPDGVKGLKTCIWCEAKSTIDNKIDQGQHFCPDNPIISQIFDKAVQIAKKEQVKSKEKEQVKSKEVCTCETVGNAGGRPKGFDNCAIHGKQSSKPEGWQDE